MEKEYLQGIETWKEDTQSISKEIQARLEELEKRASLQPLAWIPADKRRPYTDDERVIVMTDTGATYFASTINGRFMKNVAWWMPLPQVFIKP